MNATAHGKRVKIIKIECGLRKLQSNKNCAGVGLCRARGKIGYASRVVAESLCFLSVVHAYRPTRDMRVEHSATRPRDLRSFEIRFECDVPRPHMPCAVIPQTTLTNCSTKNINLSAVCS